MEHKIRVLISSERFHEDPIACSYSGELIMSLKVPSSMEVIFILAICISYLIPVLLRKFLKSNPFVLIDKIQNSYQHVLKRLPICCSLMLLPCCTVLGSCFLLNSKERLPQIITKAGKVYVVGIIMKYYPHRKGPLLFFLNKK